MADKGFNAAQIIRELGKEIQGGGGGQAFFATAGGKNVAGLTVAIDKALNFIKCLIIRWMLKIIIFFETFIKQ